MSQTHTPTCALLRMRFALPVASVVMTYSLPPSAATQTGVSTATPVLRNVRSEM
jgi:hypothetical protein